MELGGQGVGILTKSFGGWGYAAPLGTVGGGAHKPRADLRQPLNSQPHPSNPLRGK